MSIGNYGDGVGRLGYFEETMGVNVCEEFNRHYLPERRIIYTLYINGCKELIF